MSGEIGRNDPCFCGSGKKFKKCCLGKDAPKRLLRKDPDILPARQEIDYGVPQPDDDFFDRNEPKEVSAAKLVYFALTSPQAIEVIAGEVRKETDRHIGEAEEINALSSPEALVGFLKKAPDMLNYPLVIQKFFKYEEASVDLLLAELRKSSDDSFVEWALKLIYLSDRDVVEDIIDIIEKDQRDAYAVSLLCLLLGFYDHPKSRKLLWDYFHYFKIHFPRETYSEGPLLALYETESFGFEPDDEFDDEGGPILPLPSREHIPWDEDVFSTFSDDELVGKLRVFGVPFEKEVFLKDIHRHHSAESLSEEWFKKYPISARGTDEDFLWFACMELWRRWAPDVMFDERLSDMMDEGYDLLDKKKDLEACDIWLKVWGYFKIRYKHVRSINEADKDYCGIQSWHNWCQDFEMHLGNAMRRERAYISKARGYFRDFYSLLPESPLLIIQNMMMAEADALMLSGDVTAGDALFQKVIDLSPDDVWGYIRWGDNYAPNMKSGVGLSDPVKAESIYRMALGRRLEDEREVKNRIRDLCKV